MEKYDICALEDIRQLEKEKTSIAKQLVHINTKLEMAHKKLYDSCESEDLYKELIRGTRKYVK